ncbi:hypothetical protein [Vibrio alginolyticus]|uniref:hypothetical protein n=1 Tax=Vibrio alginolyticus TaxID=663 RepID=UPI00215BAC7D|nr:hypothetical protein [Vibrio alginolyticus]EKL9831786.1 hypothetical protein [Vibrio alginolyticus]ELA7833214.1 hypothetical protein [Vibrio alginolyticus]MCR9544606.1 hypothetical protein [Vibrio alginolyticus]
MHKKPRKLSYKHFKAEATVETLQELLQEAIQSEDSPYYHVDDRIEYPTDNEKIRRYINTHMSAGERMDLYQMVYYESGTCQMTIGHTANATSHKITPVAPNELKSISKFGKDENTEFLESMLYFGVLDNHVVLMSSKALGHRDLENHLKWLLRRNSGKISAESNIFLSDQPTKQLREKLEKTPAKSVVIGSDIAYEATVDGAPVIEDFQEEISKSKQVVWQPKGLGSEIIDFLRDKGVLNSLTLDDSLDDSNLHLSLTFKYNYKTSKSGQRVIDTIATSLRHLDEEDVVVNLKGIGMVKGSELKLSLPIQALYQDNGMVDEVNLYNQMNDWLTNKLISEVVDSDLHEIAIAEEL